MTLRRLFSIITIIGIVLGVITPPLRIYSSYILDFLYCIWVPIANPLRFWFGSEILRLPNDMNLIFVIGTILGLITSGLLHYLLIALIICLCVDIWLVGMDKKGKSFINVGFEDDIPKKRVEDSESGVIEYTI